MATPRQELIKMAVTRFRRWQNEKHRISNRFGGTRTPRVEEAIEAIVDECRTCEPGTLGKAMLDYYRNATDTAIHRLILAVDYEAHKHLYE